MMLPSDKALEKVSSIGKKLLILSEGFEKRSAYWIKQQDKCQIFDDSLLLRYKDGNNLMGPELLQEITQRTKNKPIRIEYDRYDPAIFEMQISQTNYEKYDEIFLDISSMSKLLIMVIIFSLRTFNGSVTITYSEPKWWRPKTKKECDNYLEKYKGQLSGLGSIDVDSIKKTPQLSSTIMQNDPVTLIAFVSFNEYLLRNLFMSITPSELHLIYPCSERFEWRNRALESIGSEIMEEYNFSGSPKNTIKGHAVSDHKGVFEELARIYKENCYSNRIILSPTGTKWHTVSCAFFKICCPDIHVECPIPKKYSTKGFTSDEVHAVHSMTFNCFKEELLRLSDEYQLNG